VGIYLDNLLKCSAATFSAMHSVYQPYLARQPAKKIMDGADDSSSVENASSTHFLTLMKDNFVLRQLKVHKPLY